MQRRYLLAIIIFVVFVIVAVSGFLFVKHLNEKKLSEDEKQFFDMKWISFCGRINRKQWVSHNAVNNVANKILQIKNSYPTKKRKKNIFPYSILFVSSEGNKCIVWLNSEYFSLNKEKVFMHNLTDEEFGAFFLAVAVQQ